MKKNQENFNKCSKYFNENYGESFGQILDVKKILKPIDKIWNKF